MNGITSRNEWIIGQTFNILEDKKKMVEAFIFQMLNKTTRIFKYNNLPDTIPKKDAETIFQVNGFGIATEVKGEPYIFTGGLGGTPNPYYLPTIATVANPALKFSANLKIDEECVIIRNDNYYQGLMPLLNKYANLIVEAELSLKNAIINARVPALVQADNDNTYKSADEFFKKIVEGKEYGIISSKEFFDGIRTHDFYKQAYIKDLLEAIQYIRASLFSEIGLRSLMSMKREAINEAEASMNDDVLFPSIETMLECRQQGWDDFNKKYGTNVTVELDGVWARKLEEEELKLDIMENEAETTETDNSENHEETEVKEDDIRETED